MRSLSENTITNLKHVNIIIDTVSQNDIQLVLVYIIKSLFLFKIVLIT